MSLPVSTEIHCRHCGAAGAFTAWRSLNASLSPPAREALLRGELWRFVCGSCGARDMVLYPMLYHDMARQLMIQLLIGDDAQGTQTLPTGGLMKDYQFREVTSPNQLAEKIRVFEDGLDDRVVELAKFLLRRGAALERETLSGELLYDTKGRTAAGEEVIRFVVVSREGLQQLQMPMAKLDQIRSELGNKLTPMTSEAGKWMTVNEDYAAHLAKQL